MDKFIILGSICIAAAILAYVAQYIDRNAPYQCPECGEIIDEWHTCPSCGWEFKL